MPKLFYFIDSEGERCSGFYDAEFDYFSVARIDDSNKEEVKYHPEEVEFYLNRGIWKRYS